MRMSQVLRSLKDGPARMVKFEPLKPVNAISSDKWNFEEVIEVFELERLAWVSG